MQLSRNVLITKENISILIEKQTSLLRFGYQQINYI